MSRYMRSSWWRAVVVGLGLSVSAPGGVAALVDEDPPSVVGLGVEQAEDRLRDWEFDVVIDRVNPVPPQVDPAEVIVVRQALGNPGWSIEQIAPVVEVHLGVVMPWLEGASWEDARTLLHQAGLVPSPLLASAADDDVVVLAPTAGLPIEFGEEVRLKLEPSGATPSESTIVPLIVGLSVEEAAESLDDRGLSIVPVVIGEEGEIGAIVSQSPAAGTPVEAGSSVRATATRVVPELPGRDDSETPTPVEPPSERQTPPGRGDSDTGTRAEPTSERGGRDGLSRMWRVPTAVAIAVLVLGGTVSTARHARRIRARRDLEWVNGHVVTVPRPDLAPRTAEQDAPDAAEADIRFVGDRGPAPTYTQEVSRS